MSCRYIVTYLKCRHATLWRLSWREKKLRWEEVLVLMYLTYLPGRRSGGVEKLLHPENSPDHRTFCTT
jgi:hypothetical protein